MRVDREVAPGDDEPGHLSLEEDAALRVHGVELVLDVGRELCCVRDRCGDIQALRTYHRREPPTPSSSIASSSRGSIATKSDGGSE